MNPPSAHFQRALVLRQQGRNDLVEQELRQHLVAEPNDPQALAVLAEALLELDRLGEAETTAHQAIASGPDAAFSHYVLARILSQRNREDEAVPAIQEAIRLDPTDADYHAVHGAIEFDRQRWAPALAAAEAGLQFDPEHVGCNNLRAMSLVKLGRKAEAGATIEAALARNPDDAFSHANQGWTKLEQGRRKEAMQHFRESLRIDPGNDWARAGLVEAIKAGNPVYGIFLNYFLWVQKLSPGARWGILLGGYFGSRLLRSLGRSNPSLAAWTTPVVIAYTAFALFTWLAQPLFNLTLFLHPIGRHALSPDQRSQASWVGLCIGLALGSLAIWATSGRDSDLLTAPVVFGLLAIPASMVFNCSSGWPRRAAAGIALLLATLGLSAVAVLALLRPPADNPTHQLGSGAFGFFLVGTFLSQWVGNWLMSRRPER